MVPLFEVSHKETKLNFFELRAAVYVLSLFIQQPVCDRLYSSAAYTMRRSYNAPRLYSAVRPLIRCGPLSSLTGLYNVARLYSVAAETVFVVH
jgi:hypothetical protein